MRITLNLDDGVLILVKQYANAQGVGVSKALSELARKGLNAPCPTRRVNGLRVFDPGKDSPRVTTKQLRDLL
jgi:hypothetical protein